MTHKVSQLFTWRTAIINSNLPPTTRHVLLTLSLYMSEAGENAFPATRTLAKNTGLSERSVCTHLEKAEQQGWLRKEMAGLAGQKWKAHRYVPMTPKLLKEVQHEATEGGSVAKGKALKEVQHEGTEPRAKGTEPDDKKALKEVQSNTPKNTPKKERGAKRASRLNVDELPEEWRTYCREKRPDLDPESVFEDFHDYWIAKPGKDGTKESWIATWRMWVRRQKQTQPAQPRDRYRPA